MSEVIISALIASITSVIVSLIGSIADKRKLEYRLESLERKIDKHNSYGDKIGKIQTDIEVIKTDISYLKK